MPVGKGQNINSFKSFKIDLKKGDSIYLTTDGFADQFGGPKGKKFMHKQLLELISNLSKENFQNQKNVIEETFENWKGNLEQVDDVCIIGIRI